MVIFTAYRWARDRIPAQHPIGHEQEPGAARLDVTPGAALVDLTEELLQRNTGAFGGRL
jgi:hypothetical protein